MVFKLLLIFLGGGTGACLRYLASVGVRALIDGRDPAPPEEPALGLVPLATLGVNLLGCLLVGVAIPALAGAKEETRLLLVIGLLGGFTTFSAFGLETFTLITQHRAGWAVGYALASAALGVVGVALGHAIGTRLGA